MFNAIQNLVLCTRSNSSFATLNILPPPLLLYSSTGNAARPRRPPGRRPRMNDDANTSDIRRDRVGNPNTISAFAGGRPMRRVVVRCGGEMGSWRYNTFVVCRIWPDWASASRGREWLGCTLGLDRNRAFGLRYWHVDLNRGPIRLLQHGLLSSVIFVMSQNKLRYHDQWTPARPLDRQNFKLEAERWRAERVESHVTLSWCWCEPQTPFTMRCLYLNDRSLCFSSLPP